jgi:hypothetical protein
MIVEELVAVLGMEVDQASLQRVTNAFNAFGKGGLAIASAVAGAFLGVAGAVYQTAEAGDQLAATAEKLGETTDTMQELNYATGLTDTSAEALAIGLKFLSKNAAEAAQKGGDAAKAFNGIRLHNADGSIRKSSELYEDLADKIVSLPDQASRIKLATDVLGRAGADLLPMLMKGSAGIRAFRQEARETGYVMNAETIAAAEKFDDTLKRLNMQLVAWRNRLAGPLIERFTRMLERLTGVVMKQGGVVEKLADAVGLVIDGLEWLLEHDTALRVVIWGIVTAITAWAISALAAAGASGALGFAAVSAAIAAAAAWAAAILPIVIFAGLIALLIDDLYAFATGGKSAIGELIASFAKINPDDSPFVVMLKRAGSLLFDLTDPQKWKNLGQAIFDWVLTPVTKLVEGLRWVLEKTGLADRFKGSEKVNTNLDQVAPGWTDPLSLKGQTFGQSMREKFPGLFRIPDAISGGQALGEQARQEQVMFSPVSGFPAVGKTPGPVLAPTTTINVTVPPGTDAQGVADVVSVKFDEAWKKNMRETLATTGRPTK